jgi:Family of unknown function (DUF6504)
MSVVRGEPVEVSERNGRPMRFVWRGRMYTVLFVVDRRLAPAEPETGGLAGREYWRVEATPGRQVPPAVYELCHDMAADRWSVSQG